MNEIREILKTISKGDIGLARTYDLSMERAIAALYTKIIECVPKEKTHCDRIFGKGTEEFSYIDKQELINNINRVFGREK